MTLRDLTAEEKIMTNENGGKQSYTPARFDLIPAEVLADCAVVLGQGAEKYGEDNWKNIDVNDHINHAVQHLYAFLVNHDYEDLTHAACRVMFACHCHQHLESVREPAPIIRGILESQEKEIAELQSQLKYFKHYLENHCSDMAKLKQFSPVIYDIITKGQ